MMMLASIFVCAVAAGQPETAAMPKTVRAAPRVLVMKDLSRRVVGLVGVTADQYVVEASRRAGSTRAGARTTGIARRDVLAVLPGDVVEEKLLTEEEVARGLVATVGGERIGGTLAVAEAEKDVGAATKDTIVWSSPLIGVLSMPLDEVAWIEFAPGPTGLSGRKAGEDRVILANGDVLDGFVDVISATEVVVEIEGKTRKVETPRVARVEFSNPTAGLSGAMVWLASGDVLRVASLIGNGAGGEVTLARAGSGNPVTVKVAEVAGLVERSGGLVALATIAPTGVTPFGARSAADPIEVGSVEVPLGAADVTLPSPMVVTWALPEGATRVAWRAELPAASRVWGDCVLIVEQVGEVRGGVEIGGREVARVRLNGDAPEAEINVELTARGLRVTLDEGAGGPIQDRVVLRGGLVLVK
jgi:hypothetical protein